MDKRAKLNREFFLFRELKDEEIPDDQLKLVEGMERVRTWKPNPLKNATTPALILTGFLFYILFLAKLWIWMLAAPLPGLAIFLWIYFDSPTICRVCKREMNYFRPTLLQLHHGAIAYDWCPKCKKYCNVHWAQRDENGGLA